ncbi:hypothetical protein CWB73_00395 [Pseudoalteromonas phenolica]|uniref:Uncharacterized protein n=1 Tax=Pseudoalteromonas phenolica TaxID=161398 RepID=A0A5S3YYT3_9GAMM|nr:hypothetical protein [Pseudoalteromonas phenolica]TMP84161.1 hypothetical protein CWB73_00395 [Pseudoalteromonas phenolica]
MELVNSLLVFLLIIFAVYAVVKELLCYRELIEKSKNNKEYTNVVNIEAYLECKAIGYHEDARKSDSLASQIVMLRKHDEAIEKLHKSKGD